jgi:hypothetical protein
MKKTKHEPKPLMAVRFREEARQMIAKRKSAGRFLEAAAGLDPSTEPAGRLAGGVTHD